MAEAGFGYVDAFNEIREQMEKLKDRLHLYQEQFKQAQRPEEREELRAKIRTYRTAIRDVQVQIDHLDPPAQRKARKAQRKRLDVGAMTFDFFEYTNACWSDLEGHSWQQVEAGDFVNLGASMEQLQEWMAEGAQRLSDRQRQYLDAYYNEGLSQQAIAQRYGVDKSSVSRVIRNGLNRMQVWVDSKKLIASCADGKGGFDWVRYLSQVPALTDRQRQLMLLVLSKFPKNQEELAEKLELESSTVSRTLSKAGKTIHQLQVSGKPISRPEIRWDKADKLSLALDTGMPLYFYYKYCFRGQRVGGMSRYRYEMERRREAGESPEKVAREMGLRPRTVRSAFSSLRRSGVQVGHLPPPDNLGAQLDPETYVKLQRMVTGHAGT